MTRSVSRHPHGVVSLACLIALSAMPCAAIARGASKGCGASSRAGSAAARSADDWVSATSLAKARNPAALGAAPVVDDAARLGADDLARLGGDELAPAMARGGDDTLSRLAEHGLDAADLAELAIDDDEQISSVELPAPRTGDEAPARVEKPELTWDLAALSSLEVRGDARVLSGWEDILDKERILDVSRATAPDFARALDIVPAKQLVLIAPELEARAGSLEATVLGVGNPSGLRSRRRTLDEFARSCVEPDRSCIIMGCPPDATLTCGTQALSLLDACRSAATSRFDCLRARAATATSPPPTLTFAFISAFTSEGAEGLRLIRSER